MTGEESVEFGVVKEVFRAMGDLYQEFKTTDMDLDTFRERGREIWSPVDEAGSRYVDVGDLYEGLKDELGDTRFGSFVARGRADHEKEHELLAIEAARELGMGELTYHFGLVPSHVRLLGVGPKIKVPPVAYIDFPKIVDEVGGEDVKGRVIEFKDRVLEHQEPSLGDLWCKGEDVGLIRRLAAKVLF